jgi:uncharacterized protein YecT (DUF1311 family)
MKTYFLLVFGFFSVASSSPAHALDCKKVSTSVEKLICGNQELKRVDEAMSAAYFKLLRETTDPDFHEYLIRSQRRWVQVRSQGPESFGAADNDKTDDRQVLLKITRDRLDSLRSGELIRKMEQQRDTASKENGGPFAGYATGCISYPPPYSNWGYDCAGTWQRQNHDRICGAHTSWASGHTTEYRLVSALITGEPKLVARCSTGYETTNERCPDSLDDAETKAVAHWNTNPQPDRSLPTARRDNLWKYDPDIELDEPDPKWMRDCLFAPNFPPAELNRSDGK